MNERAREDAVDEIYAAAFTKAQELGICPTDDDAEALINAIREYLGPVSAE